MPKRICNTCGAAFTPTAPRQARCPQHQGNGTGWSHNRDRNTQRQFRAAVLERDGYACRECGGTTDLRAAHVKPLAHGGTNELDTGVCWCKHCDMAIDPYAR